MKEFLAVDIDTAECTAASAPANARIANIMAIQANAQTHSFDDVFYCFWRGCFS